MANTDFPNTLLENRDGRDRHRSKTGPTAKTTQKQCATTTPSDRWLFNQQSGVYLAFSQSVGPGCHGNNV